MAWCKQCDPKYFTVYGFCRNCQRRCEYPLFDPDKDHGIREYCDKEAEWNKERSDLIADIFRKGEAKDPVCDVIGWKPGNLYDPKSWDDRCYVDVDGTYRKRTEIK